MSRLIKSAFVIALALLSFACNEDNGTDDLGQHELSSRWKSADYQDSSFTLSPWKVLDSVVLNLRPNGFYEEVIYFYVPDPWGGGSDYEFRYGNWSTMNDTLILTGDMSCSLKYELVIEPAWKTDHLKLNGYCSDTASFNAIFYRRIQ